MKSRRQLGKSIKQLRRDNPAEFVICPGSDFFLTLKTHWTSKLLGSPFLAFTHAAGCDGLATVNNLSLEILAIHATRPRTGQLREFIRQAKNRFATVTIDEMINPILERAVIRYGFRPVTLTGFDGKPVKGFRWGLPLDGG